MDVYALSVKLQEEGGAQLTASLRSLGAEVAKTALTLGSLTLGINKLVEESSTAQYAVAQLEAVIKSTSSIAGQSSEALQAQASALQQVTTFGDDAIIRMQSLLLTFTKVRGEVFNQSVPAIIDMAQALGTDLQGAVMQVGKALNDPVQGINALRRAGVSFTEEQKATIKSLVDTNRIAEAQTIILAELQTEFGGAARAARDTLGGALAGLNNAFGELFEVTRENSGAVIALINEMTDALVKLNENFDAVKEAAVALGVVLSAVFVAKWAQTITGIGTAARSLVAAFAIAQAASGTWGASMLVLQTAMDAVIAKASTMWAAIGGPFGAALIAIGLAGAAAINELDEINQIYDDIDKSNAAFDARRREARAQKEREAQEERDRIAAERQSRADAERERVAQERQKESDHNETIRRNRAIAVFEAERERLRNAAAAREAGKPGARSKVDQQLIAPLMPDKNIPLFQPGELEASLASSVSAINTAMNSPEFTAQVNAIRWTNLKEGLGEGVAGAIEGGLTSGLTAAIASGRIGDLFKSLGQTMVQQIANMMVKVALTYIKFASMIEKIQRFLIANPAAAAIAAVAMLTLAHSLGGQAKQTGVAVSGGASGAQFTPMVPPVSRMTFGGTSSSVASAVTPANAMSFTIIGPNDPSAQRAIQELVRNANRRGSV